MSFFALPLPTFIMEISFISQLIYLIHFLYILAISSVLLAKYNPKLNGFLRYGKTLSNISPSSSSSGSSDVNHQQHEQHLEFDIIEKLLSLQVPKLWFSHFYLLSMILSVTGFLLLHLSIEYGLSPPDILIRDDSESKEGLICGDVARLMYFLILGHALRRLFETLFVMRYSARSKMNISHYFVGIFFYTSTNLLLLLSTDFQSTSTAYQLDQIDPLLFGACITFFLSSLDQFMNHIHLSKIVKYNLPKFGLFKYVCCAHYFDEILIYASAFAILRDFSSFLVVIWVIVNLSVSAIETKTYYKKKLGDGKVPRWAIIPFVL